MDHSQPASPVCRNTPERFEEWQSIPVAYEPVDPRWEIRRATLSDFPRIFDLVDSSFETKRPREIYDWMYRRNPRGIARCWMIIEKETERLIGTCARFPWSTNRGGDPIDGYIIGDAAIAPDWKRQGVLEDLWRLIDLHPWSKHEINFAWPNLRTRNALQKYGDKTVLSDPLTTCRLPLRRKRAGPDPSGLQKTVAMAADSLLNVWPNLLLGAGSGVCVEEVKRFDSSIDAIAERAGFFRRFWCPHSADFMNWRYLDHPLGNSVAYAALEEDRPVGYCVVTMAGEVATVMELSHVSDSPKVPRALLLRAIRAARGCGCRVIKCIATPALRSWPLLHRAGFRAVSSKVYFLVRGEAFPGLRQLENWQLGAGDIDSL